MKRVQLKKKVLNENDRIAQELRTRFEAQRALILNLISSPGAGKTALLEQTLERLGRDMGAGVLTGDIETDNDAARLVRYGFPVRQITTGGSCHLDAKMVKKGLVDLGTDRFELLFIENVGNLVCPASFDLGEASKIVLLSVTEGDDKPLKYPSTFLKSDLMIINKTDLAPYVCFDIGKARENAQTVNPDIEILEVSCATGDGIDSWMHWLEKRIRALQAPLTAGQS